MLLPFLIWLFTWLSVSHPEPLNREWLDLTTVDRVRVLLYDQDPPSVIRIQATDGPLSFLFDDKTVEFDPADGFASIHFRNDHLVLKAGDQDFKTHAVTVRNSSGTLRVSTREHGSLQYYGDFHLKNDTRGRPEIINTVPLEHYVASVVGSEMNFSDPEALRAQAVVSRTYILWSIKRSPFEHFDVKDHEQNQVYKGAMPLKPYYREAAESTRGEILTWSSRLILAAFSSTCGGVTSSNEHVWSGPALPYLRSASDQNMCSASPHFEWEFELEKQEIYALLLNRYGFRYEHFTVRNDPAGRAMRILFYNTSGRSIEFPGNEFRMLVNRDREGHGLRSTRFTVRESGNTIIFEGSGLGHGVGLCQWGAKGFARAGWGYRDILSFYFSGTKIVDFHSIKNQRIALSG